MIRYIEDTITFSILDIYNCTYQISRDNGNTWTTIALGIEAIIENEGEDNETVTNSYEWTITGPEANECRVKFIDNEDSEEYIGDPFEIRADKEEIINTLIFF